jgi:Beta-fructosidases (levanase/invertase)
MQWTKKGLIYGATGEEWWMNNSALQPTPIVIGDIIRVFAGFRDCNGVGRIGYVDVEAKNPSNIISVKDKPCLDIGEKGCFDDNGVVPCAITKVGNLLYLFYAGYNIGYHVRMTIFSGLAISDDNGETFKRYSKVPIMERTENETLFRVIHTALKEENEWKMYYGAGNKFIQGQKKTLPVYEIEMISAIDFEGLRKEGTILLHNEGEEYRIGRPYVVKDGNLYRMFFCKGTESITYRLAYAESNDGINWIRKDNKLNLDLSVSGWDSEMMAYPSFIRYGEKAYLFYNGNNYGYEGFGYAELNNE